MTSSLPAKSLGRRFEARLDRHGFILLMEEQDRALWDWGLIQRAQEFLSQAATGTSVSTFHMEAAIACQYCTAKSYAETNWPAILRFYNALLAIHRSPIYLLNRAIVVAEIEGPLAGLGALKEIGEEPTWRHYHLYDATVGELYRRSGDLARARRHLEAARSTTQSRFDRELIDRRLAKCVS